MASDPRTQRPNEPVPGRPQAPQQQDSVLESLGKAITDPVRESAGEVDDEVEAARERAARKHHEEPPADVPPQSPVRGR